MKHASFRVTPTGAPGHQSRALGERVVEGRADVRRGNVRAFLIALEAKDLVRIDGERQVAEDLHALAQHYVLRDRTACAMSRMCSELEPQHAPTMLQPASSSAGYSRAIASGPSS